MKKTFLGMALAGALLGACGGEISQASTGTSSGGEGGSGGGAAPADCTKTTDGLSVTVQTADGVKGSCGLDSEQLAFDGAVVSGGSGQWELDVCPPNAFCDLPTTILNIDAPGFDPTLPVGTFVHVLFSWGSIGDGVCSTSIVVTNLPSWGGVENPTESGERLWFAGADGESHHIDPFEVGTELLDCDVSSGQGCGSPGLYQWHFASKADPAEDVRVPMGQTVTWGPSVGPHAGSYSIRNLRSYHEGICGGYGGEWAFWVARADTVGP